MFLVKLGLIFTLVLSIYIQFVQPELLEVMIESFVSQEYQDILHLRTRVFCPTNNPKLKEKYLAGCD